MKQKKEGLNEALNKKFGKLYVAKNGRRKPLLERDEVQYNKDFKGEDSPYWQWTSKTTSEHEYSEPVASNPDITADTPYREASEETQELADRMREAMEHLPKRQRQVIQLLWEGRSQVEISSLLKITEGAVRVHLTRAQNKLQRLVSE